MNTFLVVKNGSVVGTQMSESEADHPSLHNGESVMHLLVPEGETPETVDVVDGAIVPNAEKKAAVLAAAARATRDRLLAETDWIMISDSAASNDCKTAFMTYRQSLRDVSSQEGFPQTINWPQKPEYVKG